jgi:Holliday junction resolvase RusA-like endonuclease
MQGKMSKTVAECLKDMAKPARRHTTAITLPLPERACSPNARCHWAVKAKAVKNMRTAGLVAGSKSMVRYTSPVIDMIVYSKVRRGRDRDNAIACAKGAVDGLADAGLFANDKLVRWGTVEFDIDKDNPRIVLFIKEYE